MTESGDAVESDLLPATSFSMTGFTDNARPHVAGVCQQFLQDEGIEAIDWPAHSPDLNPIEHNWDIMSRTIHQHHVAPQTVQKLVDALVQVWEEIPQETICPLIRSMPRFFKVATFCFDDCFADSWHSLDELQESHPLTVFQDFQGAFKMKMATRVTTCDKANVITQLSGDLGTGAPFLVLTLGGALARSAPRDTSDVKDPGRSAPALSPNFAQYDIASQHISIYFYDSAFTVFQCMNHMTGSQLTAAVVLITDFLPRLQRSQQTEQRESGKSSSMGEKSRLQRWRERISTELDRVMEFWTQHSEDKEFGGFFTCLGQEGAVYDPLKYIWLQGRQVWMYCRLYRKVPRFHREELLNSAIAGGEFLIAHARPSSDSLKCAFVVTRDGRAVKIQRTIFSECFYIMAMDELWRITQKRSIREARMMMDQIVHWVRIDPSNLGRPSCLELNQ
ncbi:unnamed protein product [Ranitomeya imitator]|uniref:N-acylglucosamine 2-epimerase n=1 Tax=Ranitomeya imitator TaxID=111125 RepID=A0ABN9LAN8_9NEOB|nr:unnamed protein product [Ranitomeya imitator]